MRDHIFYLTLSHSLLESTSKGFLEGSEEAQTAASARGTLEAKDIDEGMRRKRKTDRQPN